MKLKIIFVMLAILSTFYAKAQDPAVSGINPVASPLYLGQTTTIEADILNGSSAPIPQANNATWTINLPPNVQVNSVVMDDPTTSGFLNIYIGPYDPLDGTIIQIISNNGDFPGGGAYLASINVTSVKLTTPGTPAPMSINAVTDPPIGTNNSANDNASSFITVVPAPVIPPVATNDVVGPIKDTDPPKIITVLSNDTQTSNPIDPTSVRLIDPITNAEVTSVTIPGQGSFTVNPDGTVTFDPEIGFSGSITVPYTIKDTAGLVSNVANITIDVVLPVTLVSFDAQKEGSLAQLRWATTEETNSEYFEIQHSVTGKEWAAVGKVASHGESATLKNYTFSHGTPVNGENLYRLKMVDKDQTFAHSRIRSVKFEGITDADLSVYPNPVYDKLNIRDISGVTQINIYDLKGVSLYQSVAPKSGEINVGNLPGGMYIVKTKLADGTVVSQKIVVSK